MCRSSSPRARSTRRESKAAVGGLDPRGYTPIGRALRTAAEALPKDGPRSVVLVSDGIDTCAPPDPCEVVKTLASQGTELVVYAIGFGVDEAARTQLTCVAQTTGGTYTDAPDGGALEQILPRVTAAAMRNYEPSGVPVRGTDQPGTAPVLRPGQYLDAIAPRTRQFYAVDATEGSTLYFGATVAFPRGAGAGAQNVTVTVHGKNGSLCGKTDRLASAETQDGEALAAQVAWDTTKQPHNPHCSGPGRYLFAVEREVADGHTARLPLEVLCGLEPAAEQAGLPPAAAGKVKYTEPGGPAKPVAGGGTFGTAATLDGSGHYTDQVRYGEFVFYKVNVDWGQALTVRGRFDGTPGAQDVYARSKAITYSPFRREIGNANEFYDGKPNTVPSRDEIGDAVPVEYRNRELRDEDQAAQSIAGEYYVAVKLGQNQKGPRSEAVPITVDVAVVGQPHAGPRYRFASAEQRTGGVFGENAAPVVTTGATESRFPMPLLLGGGAFVLVLVIALAGRAVRRR